MKKIYEAIGQDKREIINTYNELSAWDRNKWNLVGINDMIMIGKVKSLPLNFNVDTYWSLNGLILDDNNNDDIIIIEPFKEQVYNESLTNISETETCFNEPIKLSKKAIILMSTKKYDELTNSKQIKKQLRKMNVRLYEGEADLAVKMIFYDKNYIYLDITKEGYIIDRKEHPDIIGYIETIIEKQQELSEKMQQLGRNVTYRKEKNFIKNTKHEILDEKNTYEEEEPEETDNDTAENSYKMITGLTKNVEGDISLDEELYASTDIGKTRKNQEDAVLLIKDKENPKFKMMVVADGMGGGQKGEVASDITVNKLKEWFENLNKQEKACYYNGILGLKESLQKEIATTIQSEVETQTQLIGGTTLVCAIVGKDDTLVANIGDSRAYYTKNGKIEQISREDTYVQEELEKGKIPSKEASRFHEEANVLTQCIGMPRRKLQDAHIEIINNKDYDMILLFSDGVTDCLSDEDIAVACRNTDKKELAKKIVEKAIRHDSIEPDELLDYTNLNLYISGGKDNTTAAAYIQKKEDKDDEIER